MQEGAISPRVSEDGEGPAAAGTGWWGQNSFTRSQTACPTQRSGGERDPYLLEMSVPGVVACGDDRSSPVKRVAPAGGEGSMAIAFIHQVPAIRSAGGYLRR
jgi:hypothetical protein